MRFLKNLLIIFFVLAALLCAGIYYLSNIFVPGPLKDILISKAKESLGREVLIKEIGFNFPRGVFVKGVRIEEKTPGPTPFINIDEASLGLPLPDLFRNGNIMIPSLTVHKPFIHIDRGSDLRWNFSDLVKTRQPDPSQPAPVRTSPPKSKQNVFINNIVIEHAQLQIVDAANPGPPIENNIDLSAGAHLSFTGEIVFEADLTIPARQTAVKAQGKFIPRSKKAEGKLDVENLDAGYFINLAGRPLKVEFKEAYIKKTSLNFKIAAPDFQLEGPLSAPVDLTTKTQNKVRIKAGVESTGILISKTGTIIQIKGRAWSPATLIAIGGNKLIEGELTVQDLDLAVTPGKGFEARGAVTLGHGTFKIDEDKKFSGGIAGTNIFVRLDREDLALSGAFTAKDATMELPGQELAADFSWNNAFIQKLKGDISISGGARSADVKYKNKMVTLNSSLNVPAFTFNKTSEGINLKIDRFTAEDLGAATTDGKKITSTLDGQELHYTLKDGLSKLKSRFVTKVLLFEGPPGTKFSGRPEIELDLTVDPSGPNPVTYAGAVLFKHDALGLSKVLSFRAMDGKVRFTPDEIATDDLQLTFGKTAVTLKGTARDLRNPVLDMTASADTLDLAELTPSFSNVLIPLKMSVSGQARNVRLKYYGPAKSPLKADITASADVENSEFTWEKLPDKVTAINGQLQYAENWLSWKKFRFIYAGQDYSSEGSLNNFIAPEFEASLTAKDLSLKTAGNFKDKILGLTSLTGKYLASDFDVAGKIVLAKAPPDVNLNGTANVELSDLATLPGMAERLNTLDPEGIISVSGHAALPELDWKAMRLTLELTSKKFTLKGYPFNDLTGKAETLNDKRLNLSLLSAVYDGKLTVDSRMDLAGPNVPAEVSAELLGLDLAKLKEDLPGLKNKSLAGLMFFNSKFTGPLAAPDQWRGSGSVKVEDGRLIELEVLKGVWKVIFNNILVDDYKNLVFTQAQATFKISDGRLTTDDLVLKSSPVDISAKGSIDFAGNVDFDILADMRQSPIITSDAGKGVPTALITQLAKNAFAIKLTGPASKPKTSYKILPFKAIGKTTESIFQGIGSILEDVLEQQ